MSHPKVSVITVNYNHKYFPKLAVEALERSRANFDFEIVYVDNASTDPISLGFLQQAARDGRIKLVHSEKNLGFGAGNNLGARYAQGDYFFILNPDTAVLEDTLQKLMVTLDNFLKQMSDYKEEFTILKGEVDKIKSFIKEKFGVEIAVQG